MEQHLIAATSRKRSAFIVTRKFTSANEDIRQDISIIPYNKVVIIKRAHTTTRDDPPETPVAVLFLFRVKVTVSFLTNVTSLARYSFSRLEAVQINASMINNLEKSLNLFIYT